MRLAGLPWEIKSGKIILIVLVAGIFSPVSSSMAVTSHVVFTNGRSKGFLRILMRRSLPPTYIFHWHVWWHIYACPKNSDSREFRPRRRIVIDIKKKHWAAAWIRSPTRVDNNRDKRCGGGNSSSFQSYVAHGNARGRMLSFLGPRSLLTPESQYLWSLPQTWLQGRTLPTS